MVINKFFPFLGHFLVKIILIHHGFEYGNSLEYNQSYFN